MSLSRALPDGANVPPACDEHGVPISVFSVGEGGNNWSYASYHLYACLVFLPTANHIVSVVLHDHAALNCPTGKVVEPILVCEAGVLPATVGQPGEGVTGTQKPCAGILGLRKGWRQLGCKRIKLENKEAVSNKGDKLWL